MIEYWRWLVGLLVVSMCLNVVLITNVSFSDLMPTTQAVRDVDDFSVYTKAVCEDTSEGSECHDEVFVQCNEIDTRLATIAGNTVKFEEDFKE